MMIMIEIAHKVSHYKLTPCILQNAPEIGRHNSGADNIEIENNKEFKKHYTNRNHYRTK